MAQKSVRQIQTTKITDQTEEWWQKLLERKFDPLVKSGDVTEVRSTIKRLSGGFRWDDQTCLIFTLKTGDGNHHFVLTDRRWCGKVDHHGQMEYIDWMPEDMKDRRWNQLRWFEMMVRPSKLVRAFS